ncbi:hypothetical protein [Sulfitobacter dubius]|uniref:hypothetical protein n=1 Tax=Sulfitobacter dubius TaxID=218673 RepID=UPI0030DBF8DA
MTAVQIAVAQIVVICAVVAAFIAIYWLRIIRQASRPATQTIEQPPAVIVATVEHTTPAEAGVWRLDAVIESDRRTTRQRQIKEIG